MSCTKTTTNDFDYATLKIDPNGTILWNVRYDGPAGSGDYPTAIKTDYAGNVYVTGTSQGNTTDADFATLKYDDQGNLQWEKRYDFNSLRDGAVGLEVSANYQDVIITGASASTATNWDFVTIKYDASNGNALNTVRQPTGANGYDQPVSICKDDNGNIYITGAALTGNGVGNDMQTIKIDSSFAIEWVRQYDGHGYDDAGKDVKVDANGDIYVVGYAQKVDLGYDFMTIKYDDAGNILWTQSRSTAVSSDTAQAAYLDFDTENNVYVTGTLKEGGGSAAITVVYDENGNFLWETVYDSEDAIPTDMRVNLWGAVYVTGKENTSTGTSYFTVNYSAFSIESPFEYNANGRPTHVSDQIMIRFDPDVVDLSFVDNTDLNYGDVSEIITDTTLINQMDSLLEANGGLSGWTMSRIFQDWPSHKTTATSRSGNTFDLPTLWSAFVLHIPEPIVESNIDEQALCDSLNTLPAHKLRYAHPHFVGTALNVPNDPSYTNNEQASLWFDSNNPSMFTDADINVEPAWAILHNAMPREPKGKPAIKVGIFDSGINHNHEDLGANGNFGGLNGSVVDNGFDYLSGTRTAIPATIMTPDVRGHGTKVTGIVGALRNNNKGIAGIAGGDINVDGAEGVHFTSMRIIDANGAITLRDALKALEDVVILGPNNSPLVDIMNNSWRFEESFTNPISLPIFRDAVRMAFKAEIVMVNGRGNDGNDDHAFPATFFDDWGISVGASGENGEWQEKINFPQMSPDFYSSSFGRDMDLIAPGVTTMIHTTDRDNPTDYEVFNGTSASTPHVTGAAALLMGYVHSTDNTGTTNTVLAPEDIEHLLEAGAADKGAAIGYDDKTGWGLLNVGASMQLVEKPFRKILHFQSTPGDAFFVQNVASQFVELTHPYDILPAGFYDFEVVEVAVDFQLNLPANLSVANINHSAHWPLNSRSNLWGSPEGLFQFPPTQNLPLDPWEKVEAYLNWGGNSNIVRVQGYFFTLEDPLDPTKRITIPSGASVSNAVLAFSLLVNDSGVGIDDWPTLADHIHLYPNPATNFVQIQYELATTEEITIDVVDMQGRIVKHQIAGQKTAGIHREVLSLEGLSPCVYMCRLKIGESLIHKKLIKK